MRGKLSDDIAAFEDEYLLLEDLAAAAYNRFAYGGAQESLHYRRQLLRAGVAEYASPHGHVLLLDAQPVAMFACVTHTELQQRRMQTALTLMRAATADAATDADAFRARLQIAGRALMHATAGDYYLSRIAVHPDAHGRGLGSDLLAAFEAQGRQRHCQRFTLDVQADSIDAIRFYAHHGYHEIGQQTVTDPVSQRTLSYLHLAKTPNSGP